LELLAETLLKPTGSGHRVKSLDPVLSLAYSITTVVIRTILIRQYIGSRAIPQNSLSHITVTRVTVNSSLTLTFTRPIFEPHSVYAVVYTYKVHKVRTHHHSGEYVIVLEKELEGARPWRRS